MATAIEKVSLHDVDQIFLSLKDIADIITSVSSMSGSAWPNVTVPHFEIRGHDAGKISKSSQITFSPLVKESERNGWEEYSLVNQGWINESLAIVAEYGYSGSDVLAALEPISPVVFRYETRRKIWVLASPTVGATSHRSGSSRPLRIAPP
jgi:hypothetical protein